jgi:hypothetical protein
MTRWSGNFIALLAATALAVHSSNAQSANSPSKPKYLEPEILTGTIYESSGKSLFTFRRTATNVDSTVVALREYKTPDGAIVARERVRYEDGHLLSYELEEPPSKTLARITVRENSKEHEVHFEYREAGTTRSNVEMSAQEVLVNDMVAPFIIDHWESLMQGATLRVRLAAPARTESVAFKISKESENTWRGKPAVIIRMEASSFVIARFIDPLRFTMEKEGHHRVLQYTGRTTPRLEKNGRWRDLDALTVFDWK